MKAGFTSIDDQAGQAIAYVKENLGGRLDCAYGLAMGGKILSLMARAGQCWTDIRTSTPIDSNLLLIPTYTSGMVPALRLQEGKL